MPSFLDIPQELRDRIIELAIDTYTTAPQNAETAGQYRELDGINYRSWLKGKHVLYPATPVASTTQSLLRVNKSLHSQTLAALQRIKHVFELDVMLIQEYQLWATWTSHVPTFVPDVKRVHVSFRIFPKTKAGPGGYTGFRGGDGGPPAIFWQLYALLERSLRCGPTNTHIKQEKGFQAIQVLDLDVIAPIGITEEQYNLRTLRRHDQQRLEHEGKILHVVRPETWLSTIKSGIGILSGMYRDAFPMGCILYERIGTIRFMLDGEVKAEWDLAEHLSAMRYSTDTDDHYPKSRPGWCKRLGDVYEKRKAAGLPCIPIAELEKEGHE
jgi:hypothetical protein